MNPDGPVLFVHLGYSKTATTYLQEQVFPLLNSVRYRLKPAAPDLFADTAWKGYTYGALDRAFKRAPDVWNCSGNAIMSAVLGPSRWSDSHVLVSDEGASVWFDPATVGDHVHGLWVAARHTGFSRLCVLCVIRRQDQRLGSGYAQVSDRRPVTQATFEKFVKSVVNTDDRWPNGGNDMEYAGVWRALTEVIGADNVLLLPYEMLFAERDSFCHRLLTFLRAQKRERLAVAEAVANSSRSNQRSTATDTWAVRPRQPMVRLRLRPVRLARKLGLPPYIGLPPWEPSRARKVVMTEALRKVVLARYGEENRALSDTLRLDLDRYGYFKNT